MSIHETTEPIADDRYFLEDRDWLRLNRMMYATMPYAAHCYRIARLEDGDVGFDGAKAKRDKARDSYESVEDLFKVSIFLNPHEFTTRLTTPFRPTSESLCPGNRSSKLLQVTRTGMLLSDTSMEPSIQSGS